ncbi:alpha/beta fold hydrolase [Paraburkholderia acidisoli]|uniref:Alpha/beta fold hydrolase n=1 Tax=Paraburkholderia acidisoli TaxID=2571748 RepID=A0A7Z2JI04_9BURK|nr:alpha/beta hydrolase [Paraburkholderia acidisoli]QGZ63815.1 alpha/beta fold hydrolase [Paraburkholderia acidisoli]
MSPLVLAVVGAVVVVAATTSVVLAIFTKRATRVIEASVPMDGKLVDVDGDRIHYVEYGEGPPVVFVHGLSGQMRNFAWLPIAALAREHRVILIDRPGAGYSTRGAQSQANIYAQARTVARFIETMRLEAPVLVGHSLGGAIALAVALEYPRAVERIALIAPLTHVQTEVPKAFRALVLRSKAVRRFVSRTFATPVGLATSAAVLKQVFAPEPVPDDFPTRGGGLLSLRPSGFYSASADLVAIEDADDLAQMEQRYGQLTIPIDVLFGREDVVLDWRRHGDALRRKSELVTLKVVSGGHMLPVTAPCTTFDWLLSAIAGTAHASSPREIRVEQPAQDIARRGMPGGARATARY